MYVLTVIDKGKTISATIPMRLTNSAKNAFDKVGLEGPWNKEQLLRVIFNGDYNNIATTPEDRNKLTDVMEDVIIHMKSYDETKRIHFDHVCKKIRKAGKDLMKETMTL